MVRLQPLKASVYVKLLEDEQKYLIREGAVPVNDVYIPFWTKEIRYEIYYGGRGSGKSRFIAQKLVKKCVNDAYFKCVYCRKHGVNIKESQYDILKKVIEEMGVLHLFKFNETTMRITCTNGNCFIAKGLDDAEKTKSIEEPSCLWCEEITEFEQEDFTTLNNSLRTKKAALQTYISFNPVQAEHWVCKFFFDSKDNHAPNEEFKSRISLCRTTLYHNHFIDQEQYRQDIIIGSAGNPNIIRVNLEGDWGLAENKNPWLYSFDPLKHLRKLEFLPSFPVYLSFDFNNDPFACVAFQFLPNLGHKSAFVNFIKEFSGMVKLEEMCQRIKMTYPSSIIFVTGDRSGNNEDIGRNQTLYEMIQSLLSLSDKQMYLNTHNLEHADSRILCNIMFSHYPNVYIDPIECPNLVRQCQAAAVDIEAPKASHLLKDRAMHKNDEFDGMRYAFQTFFNKFVRETYLKILKK